MYIVADTDVSPFACARNIFCGHKVSVRDTMFLILFRNILCPQQSNVSQFAQPKKHQEQQCVRNNTSLFARASHARVICGIIQANLIHMSIKIAMQHQSEAPFMGERVFKIEGFAGKHSLLSPPPTLLLPCFCSCLIFS